MDAGRRAVRWASPDATVRILRYHVPVPAVRHGPIGIVVEFAEFVQVRVDGRLAAEEDELLARVSRARSRRRSSVVRHSHGASLRPRAKPAAKSMNESTQRISSKTG